MNERKKITIGIDLDDTISNSNEMFLKYGKLYNEEKKINFPIDETQWDVDKAFGWSDNDYKEFCRKYLKTLLNNVKTKENVGKIIQELKNEGHKIIIITARHEEEIDDPYTLSKEWLEKNNIYFDKLIVNSRQKEIDCLKNDVGVFIDDNLKNCISVYDKLHIPVFLFNSIYNKHASYPNIERIYSWDEAYMKIKNVAKPIS